MMYSHVYVTFYLYMYIYSACMLHVGFKCIFYSRTTQMACYEGWICGLHKVIHDNILRSLKPLMFDSCCITVLFSNMNTDVGTTV